jgi:hypothetical protein
LPFSVFHLKEEYWGTGLKANTNLIRTRPPDRRQYFMQNNLELNGSTDGKIDLLKSSRKSVDTLAGLDFTHLPQIQTPHPSVKAQKLFRSVRSHLQTARCQCEALGRFA